MPIGAHKKGIPMANLLHLYKATLSRANLRDTNLSWADLGDVNLRAAIFV